MLYILKTHGANHVREKNLVLQYLLFVDLNSKNFVVLFILYTYLNLQNYWRKWFVNNSFMGFE